MWRSILSKNMAVCFSTGFASGLPLFFLYQTLPVWFRDNGLDLKTIAAFALVSNPYTLKFLWAPVFDHFRLPFGGRRRGWTFCLQILLVLAFALFSMLDPKQDLWLVAALSFVVAFLSACQDIVLDAYRRELLTDDELGLGSSVFINAYRFSSLVPGSLALIMADSAPWSMVHLLIAGFMGLGLLSTYWMDEPEVMLAPRQGIRGAVIEPFVEFFKRKGVKSACTLLAFMLLYKLGDSMATALASPFYMDLGFSKSEIGSVVKVASLSSTIVGSLVGGLIMLRIGINRALWIFGAVQVVSILGFYLLAAQSPTLGIAQERDRSPFLSMADFKARTHVLDRAGSEYEQFVYVRPRADDRCEKGNDACLPDRGLIYVNELGVEALRLCVDDADACFSAEEADLIDAARRRGVWPSNTDELAGIIGRSLTRVNIEYVFVVRSTKVTVSWFESLTNRELSVVAKKKLKELLDQSTSLKNTSPFDEVEGFSNETRLLIARLLEVRADVNTASLNVLGSKPPVHLSLWLLFWVVSFEYLGVGLGTAAFVAFISSVTNRQHTATQFALLTSVAAIPRTFINATTGWMVAELGYEHFFVLCTLLALPGMVLLIWVAPFRNTDSKVRA